MEFLSMYMGVLSGTLLGWFVTTIYFRYVLSDVEKRINLKLDRLLAEKERMKETKELSNGDTIRLHN